MTEDEMIGWHHRLDGHEFEQAPGDGEGQRSLVCCSSCGHKESDLTEKLTAQFRLMKLQCFHIRKRSSTVFSFQNCFDYLVSPEF